MGQDAYNQNDMYWHQEQEHQGNYFCFRNNSKNSSNHTKKNLQTILGQNLYHGNEQENQGYENTPNDLQPSQNQGYHDQGDYVLFFCSLLGCISVSGII